MSNLPVIQKTVQKTNEWLDEIMEEMDWADRKLYKALKVVLQTLRDRLSVEEATDLGAQLPLLIRGTFYECWNPGQKTSPMRKPRIFTEIVNREFSETDYLESEDISRAVLRVVRHHVSEGEINDVIASLPKGLRTLWN